MTNERFDDELPADMQRAVELLRASREPSAEWKARVVRAATGGTRQSRARVLIPLAAVIAGVMIGGTGMYAWMRQHQTAVPAIASSVPSAAGDVRVKFSYHAPTASQVAIVGDFNQWRQGGTPLRHTQDGVWQIEILLAPGRYAYSFIVDGKLARDPVAPQVRDDDFGSSNSVLMVKGS